MPKDTKLTIFAVSDSTGDTAYRMANAAAKQFQDSSITVEQCGYIRTEPGVRAVVQKAVTNGNSVILYTLVSLWPSYVIYTESWHHNIEAFGLLGFVTTCLARRLQLTPLEKPGLLEEI